MCKKAKENGKTLKENIKKSIRDEFTETKKY